MYIVHTYKCIYVHTWVPFEQRKSTNNEL